MNTVNLCRALPDMDLYMYLSGAAANQSLTVRATSSPCAWTANSESYWIRLRDSWGDDGATLRFDLEANTDATTREGRILINGAPVRVIQYGNGEIKPYYVTLRPTETVVSGLNGVGALTFFYGLGDLVPAVSETPWLQVVRVERSADRREVVFLYEENPEATPRLGTILVGGKPFTVLQQAGPDR